MWAGGVLGYRQSAAAASQWGPSPSGAHQAHSVLRLWHAEGKVLGIVFCHWDLLSLVVLQKTKVGFSKAA